MRRILLILTLAVLVLFGVWQLTRLTGQMTLEIGDIVVQAPTAVALPAALLLFGVLYILVRLAGAALRLPKTVGHWQTTRHRRLGERAVTQALIALAAGDRGDARREASRARQHLGDTPQTLLLAAEAGRLAERDDEAAAAFHILAGRPDAAFLGYRGLLRQAIAREDWPEAAALARQAEEAHPGAAWVRQERSQLAIRAGNWAEALDLAESDAPRAALAAGAAGRETEPTKAMRYAKQAWGADKSLAPAVLAYAARLRTEGNDARALAAVSQAWKLAPHPDLAAFVLTPIEDPLSRVQAAKRLTATSLDHPESQFLLARASLDARLTGEARHHAELARTAGLDQRRLWLLIAELEEEESGDTEAGRQAQREALRRAATAEPDPIWQCSACHASHPAWMPACSACRAPGSLRWESGAHAGRGAPQIQAVDIVDAPSPGMLTHADVPRR